MKKLFFMMGLNAYEFIGGTFANLRQQGGISTKFNTERTVKFKFTLNYGKRK